MEPLTNGRAPRLDSAKETVSLPSTRNILKLPAQAHWPHTRTAVLQVLHTLVRCARWPAATTVDDLVERATGFLVLRTLRASLCSMVLRSASTLDAFRTLVTSQGTAEGVAEDESIKLRAPCINAVQLPSWGLSPD